MGLEADWSAAWKAAQPKVLAYCRRSLRSQADAEDVAQRVALRSWRGFAGFRQDAAFTTWTLAIARREIIRFVQARKPEVLTDNPDLFEAAAAPEATGEAPDALIRAACVSLAQTGLASELERDVLLARLDDPEATWRDIAIEVGGDGNACAVAHCRAIPKLRLHLFLTAPEALGGRGAIMEAYHATKQIAPPPGLTEREAELFEAIVLQRGARQEAIARAAVALRSACDKVIRRMPMRV